MPEKALTQFLRNIVHDEPSWDPRVPLSQWRGVRREGNSIDWRRVQEHEIVLSGNFTWEYLPENVHFFRISQQGLSGPVDTALLPIEMEILDISYNTFYGILDLTSLPPNMRKLYAHFNSFGGRISLSSLPEGMELINLSWNYFKGVADASNVPDSLSFLHLHGNDIILFPEELSVRNVMSDADKVNDWGFVAYLT